MTTSMLLSFGDLSLSVSWSSTPLNLSVLPLFESRTRFARRRLKQRQMIVKLEEYATSVAASCHPPDPFAYLLRVHRNWRRHRGCGGLHIGRRRQVTGVAIHGIFRHLNIRAHPV